MPNYGPRKVSTPIDEGVPVVCNDGVTIAKELQLKEPSEDLRAQMIRQAAERTGDAVGDGTSTATILAYAMFVPGAPVFLKPLGLWGVLVTAGRPDYFAYSSDFFKLPGR